jgi:hypothetical protein
MADSRQLALLLVLVTGCAEINESPRDDPVASGFPVADAPLVATWPAAAVAIEASPVESPIPAMAEPTDAAWLPTLVLAPARAVPVPVPLDVAALKARLRDTAAIGVLAKISLSMQMDELLALFRAHYGGAQKTSLAALRKPYDELVMKVLDMLDERDPSLARSISISREAIWEILADRERFSSMH